MPLETDTDNTRVVADVSINIDYDVVWGNKVSNDERQAYYRLIAFLEKAEKKDRRKTMIWELVDLVVAYILDVANVVSCPMKERTWIRIVRIAGMGFIVVRFLTFVAYLTMKRWWLIHKYVVYLITGLKWNVDLTLYLILLLLGWHFWLLRELEPEGHGSEVHIWIIPAHQVTGFLVALCAGSILWLLKNTFYMILEANICYLKLLERICCMILPVHATNVTYDSGLYGLLLDICVMKRENVPIWILQRLSEEYLHQFNISRPELMPQSSITGIIHDDFKLQMDAARMFVRIKTRNDLACLPDWEYQSMHALRGQEIERRDLEDYLSKEVLDLIFQPKSIDDEVPGDDRSSLGTGATISFEEFLELAVKVFKVYTFLKHNLEGSMKIKLNRLLNALILAIVFFNWLVLSQIVTTGQLASFFGPSLVAGYYLFGDNCKRVLDGFIFAFAMRPFEVGDCVIINNEQMRVTDLNLLTSAFIKYETGEEVFIPNTTLMSINITNTGEEGVVSYPTDNVEFTIDAETPLEEIQDLEAKILMYVS